MLAALIIVATTLAVAVGGCIAFGVRAMNATDDKATAVNERLVAERDRDVANAARVKATAERDNAVAQLVKTQKLAVSNAEQETERVKAEATATDSAGVVDLLNDVLSRDLSNHDTDDEAS